jgi:DNA-binding NarL/FixJ family response regulator
MTVSIRVAIVDDHAIVRQGLTNLLTDIGMQVVGAASSGPEAVTLAQTEQPDVMLLDIRMKEGDGLTALPEIKAASPETAVIMLTTYSNPTYFSQAIRNGAAGYLLKDAATEEIADAIQSAAAHRHLFDPTLLSMVVQMNGEQPVPAAAAPPEPASQPKPPAESFSLVDPISDREYDVLRCMAQGMSNAAIASALQVSVTTVKTHVTHILRKLDVSDRTQAVLVAMREGIVS